MAFPVDYAWGVAFSSLQAEGAADASDWRDWEREGRLPYSGEGNGFAGNYRDDLRLIADAGLRHVRLTVEWARLEPTNGHPDPWAIEHYREVLTAAREAGLSPWVTLIDTTLPGWFALDEKGFRDREARSYLWPRHVEACAEAFGDLVHAWVPIARPLALARDGYLAGVAPPGRTDPLRFLDTLAGIHFGLGAAWRVLKGAAPVAACYDLAEVRAADREPTTAARARRADDLHWCWTGLYRDAELVLPGRGPLAMPAYRDGAFDLIGFVVRPRVTVPESGPWTGSAMPEDVGALAHRLAEEGPERPLVALGQTITDPDRLGAVLTELEACHTDGIPLLGWLAEPAIDGYESQRGFTPGDGLWDRDRRPRATLELLREQATQAAAPTIDLSGAVVLGDR